MLSTSHRLVRHDEVSRWVSEMFAETREDTHRQIQTYMASMTARGSTPPPALNTLTQESLRRLQQGSSSQQLLLLGVSSGSGSGVVPRASTAPSIGPMPSPAARRPRKPALLAILLATLLGIALLVILVLLLRPRPAAGRARGQQPDDGAGELGPRRHRVALHGGDRAARDRRGHHRDDRDGRTPADRGVRRARRVDDARRSWTTTTTITHTHAPVERETASAGGGFLTFDTYPWTKVTEGGHVLGTTPLVHVALSAGSHVLTLDNPEQGIHQTYEVTVKSGDTVSHRLGLK